MNEENKKLTIGARCRRIVNNHASEFSIGSALLLICIILAISSPYFYRYAILKTSFLMCLLPA